MTTATIAFSEPAEKGADADFIRQTLQHALQRLMEMDAEALAGLLTASGLMSVSTAAMATATERTRHGPAR